MSTDRPTLWRVLSDSSRIIRAHFLHFLALSILFNFPSSVATIIYTFLSQPSSVHLFLSNVITPKPETPRVGNSQLLIQLLYILLVQLFNLCAVPSITYTTFHGFYGRPVKFISSLKSILVSFFPLLATMLVAEIIMGLVVFAFIILMLLTYNALDLLGIEMDYDDEFFLVFVIAIASLLVGALLYLQVQWYLMTTVVVLESKWGFAPLKRSSYLVKGTRGVVFLTILFFGIFSVILALWYLKSMANAGHEGWTCWVALQMVVFVVLSAILFLYGLAANTALFVYCKAKRGEMAFQVDEEFDGEYVRLPSDVVNVV